jgi:hypothetical protein
MANDTDYLSVLEYGEGGTFVTKNIGTILSVYEAWAARLNSDGDLELLILEEESDTLIWLDIQEIPTSKYARDSQDTVN